MNWQSEVRSWALALAGVMCLSSITYKVMTFPSLSPFVTGLNTAVATVNHPCKPGPCGTLAKIDQTMNVTDSLLKGGNEAILDADRVALAESAMLPVWNEKFTETLAQAQVVLGTANTQLTHVGPMLDAGTAAMRSVPPAIQSMTQDAAKVQPVLASADLLLKEAKPTVANVSEITANANGIMEDARKVSDKETKQFLKPVPWYEWPFKRIGEFWDIAAAIARNTP